MPPRKFQYKEDENVVTIYHNNIRTMSWYNRMFASSINVFCSELVQIYLLTGRDSLFYQCKNPTSDGDQQTISFNWMVATSVSLLVYAMILELIMEYFYWIHIAQWVELANLVTSDKAKKGNGKISSINIRYNCSINNMI